MCNRRNKPIFQGAVFLALLGGLGYAIYLYNIVSVDLEISKSEANRYLRKQESFSSQLQVVYEHRARLERSLQKEKADHKNSKLEFSKKQKEFILNTTRTKHENMNRFNSLETSHNMLKAQNKELDTEYNRLQQQYFRLSSEHSTLNNQQKRNFQLFKEQKANEIASLDEEIKTLKKQVVALRTHLKTRGEELERQKLSSSQELKRSKLYQETISTLEEEIASYKERLEKGQQRSYKTVGGDLHNSFKSGVLTQGDREKMGVGKANQTGSPGMDSRDADEHTVMDRHGRKTSLPATRFSDDNSEEEKGKRPTGENLEENNIQLRKEDSWKTLSESDQVHNDVPLRDSDEDTEDENRKHGVHVVSATDKSVNRWDSILKSERDSQRATQEGREGNEESIEEEGEEVNVGERNKRSVDDAETFREQNKNEPNDVQKQPGEGEQMANERKGGAHQGDKDGKQREQGHQSDGARRARAQYGVQQSNKRNEEEAQERDGQDNELSRQKINEQVAEMQEGFNKKQSHQQNQDREDQQRVQKIQQQVGKLSSQRNKHYEAGESPTHIELTAFPANLPRRDTVQEHRERSDADNDDEDANTEQDTEEDPDDADEDQENNNIESFEQHQQQQQQQKPQGQETQRVKPIQGQQGLHHRERTLNRALKHADDNNNNGHG